MEESWLMEDVDVEAQMRELERLQQAHCDRLVAEELQGDAVAFDFPLEREGERDFAASSSYSSSTEVSRSASGPSKGAVGQRHAQINADEQLALMMSLESSSLSSSSSQTSSTHSEDAGPSTGRQARKQTPPLAHQSTSYSALVSEEMAFHFPMSLSRHVSANPEHEEDIFCTPLQSPSRSPHPPPIPTLLAHTHISPPPPLNLMSPLAPPPSPPFAPYMSPCIPSATAGSSSNWSSSFGSSFLDSDQELARQLQEEDQSEREKRQKLSELDFHVAMNMMREESRETEASTSLVQRQQREEERLTQSERDEQIARALQEELERGGEGEGGGGRVIGQDDADLAQRLHEEEQLAEVLQRDTTRDEEIARQMSEQLNATAQPPSTSARPSEQLLVELPKWWTPCPNCPSDANRKYHLIDIPQGVNEWLSVTDPLTNAEFTVLRLQRVQNVQLYQRLQFEKRSMDLGKEEGYSVNEKLLFHTSSAAVSVICSEGLDQRLSRKGRFGSGVYFR